MGKIPQNIIDQINETADIVDIVSQRVDLQKRGKDYFGLCPFHSEKTPSFSVAPDKGIFHCFGCGKGGNSINFLMEYEKIDFMDAVMDLANQLGININIHYKPIALLSFAASSKPSIIVNVEFSVASFLNFESSLYSSDS